MSLFRYRPDEYSCCNNIYDQMSFYLYRVFNSEYKVLISLIITLDSRDRVKVRGFWRIISS